MDLGPQFTERNWREPSFERLDFEDEDSYISTVSGTDRISEYQYMTSERRVGSALEVVHHGDRTTTITPKQYDTKWAARTTEVDDTIPLFLHKYVPPRSEVTGLQGTRASRVPAMKMLAIADVEAREKYNSKLRPPHDLSPYSKQLVEHLAELGATEFPEHIFTNSTTFWDEDMLDFSGPSNPFKPVPEETIKKGGKHLRDTIRSGRSRNKQPQQTTPPELEQPKLPGMEP